MSVPRWVSRGKVEGKGGREQQRQVKVVLDAGCWVLGRARGRTRGRTSQPMRLCWEIRGAVTGQQQMPSNNSPQILLGRVTGQEDCATLARGHSRSLHEGSFLTAIVQERNKSRQPTSVSHRTYPYSDTAPRSAWAGTACSPRCSQAASRCLGTPWRAIGAGSGRWVLWDKAEGRVTMLPRRRGME